MEGAGALRLELLRPAGWEGPLRVLWRTVDSSAIDGRDFAGSPDWRLAAAPSSAEALVILVPLVDDARPGPDLEFGVELQRAPGGPELGAPWRAEVTIVDDD
jgi:hypothetical protein